MYMKGYTRLLSRCQNLGIPRNREGKATKFARRHRKLLGQSTWFQKKKNENEEEETSGETEPKTKVGEGRRNDEREYTNIMFIPHTKGGKLKKELQNLEDQLKFSDRIRFVEKTGATLANKLSRKDPWNAPCSRKECLTCKESPGACMKKNGIYQFTCQICHKDGKKVRLQEPILKEWKNIGE